MLTYFNFIKRVGVALIAFLIGTDELIAQSTAIVHTPNGTAVTVLVLNEFSQSQINAINALAASEWPNADIVANASAKYNCHAYAWYLSECSGCTKYWMNTPGDDTYWSDCSYLETTNASHAQKISYASDDHSAIKSVVAGKYDSKWGQYPVMRHDPTYTPYVSSNLKYYVKPSLAGPTLLCGIPSGYSIANLPPGASVSWSTSSNIQRLSSQGSNPASFKGIASGGGSGSFISATITSNCGSVTITKRYISTSTTGYISNPPIQGNSYVCGGGYYTATMPAGAHGLIWNFDSNNLTLLNGGGMSSSITVQFKPGAYSGWVSVQSYNSCTGPTPSPNFLGITNSCASSYMVFPNPTSSVLNIEKVDPEEGEMLVKEASDSDVYIYNSSNEQIYSGKTTACQSLDVQRWPRGMYFLKIMSGKKLLYQQKIIKQ